MSGIAICLVTITGVACSDTSGPGPSLSVEVSLVTIHPPVLAQTEEGAATIACDVDLRAVATGDGRATWMDARVLWFAGTERSTPIDSTTLAAAQVHSAWGTGGIGAGETLNAHWTFTAGAPFGAAVEYRYKPSTSDARSTTVEFTCGTVVPPGTPAPSVTQLVLENVPDRIEPSDSLTVTYTAAGSGGLWETVVALSGPCDVQRWFAEQLQPTITRSVSITLPPECALGVPLQVTVAAVDGGLQVGSRRLSTDIALVDETPPAVFTLFVPPDGGASPDLSGVYFGGDSVQLKYMAWDNHELQTLYWEVLPAGSGVDGSLAVSSRTSFDSTIFVHLAPQASGTFQLRLHASDAVGLSSNTITTSEGTALVYPSVDGSVDSTTIEGKLADAIPDARRGLVYLLQPDRSRIAVLSMSPMTLTRSITMSSSPGGFDISAGGDTLVVTLPGEGAIATVDLRGATWQPELIPITVADPALEQRPTSVRLASNGKAFILMTASNGVANTLIEVDLVTGAQRIRTDAGENGYFDAAAMGRSLDHSAIVLNGAASYFQRYDAATDHFGPRATANEQHRTPVLDASGDVVAVGLDVYDGSLHYLRQMSAPHHESNIVPVALSADGKLLYQLYWTAGVVRSRVSDGAILDRTINSIQADNFRISDDGTLLVTFDTSPDETHSVSTIGIE